MLTIIPKFNHSGNHRLLGFTPVMYEKEFGEQSNKSRMKNLLLFHFKHPVACTQRQV